MNPSPRWRAKLTTPRIILLAIGLLAVIGVIANLTDPQPAPKAASAAASASPTATARPSPASTHPTCAQIVRRWKNTTMGWTYFSEVKRDESNLVKAAARSELAAVEQYGALLNAAAGFAAHQPVPACADQGGYYQQAMRDWARSGADASKGRLTAAAGELRRGTTALGKATAELNQVAQAGG